MEYKKMLIHRREVITELSGGETNFSDSLDGITRWGGDPATQPTEEDIQTRLAEMQAEYVVQEYARHRQAEYPTLQELIVALYDTDDKAALETKRAAVKTKWPKDNSGPV